MKKGFFITPPRIIFAVLSVVCMVMIFCFSSENAEESTDTSDAVIEVAADIFISDFDELPQEEQLSIIDELSFYIRKAAHFSIYALLGFFVSLTVGKRKFLGIGSLGALFFCFLYAVSDEFHQSFSPGRSCEFRDVMIDTSGAFTGMAVSMLVMFIFFKIADRKNKIA